MDSEMTAYDLGYQAYGNERQSEQALLHQYLPLVKRTVCSLKSHCGPLIGQEDMEQIALMALLEAARRYPGEYDAGFISFAGQRIRGAILDELRRLDWRPRSVRQQAHSFNDVVRQLTRELGRYPKDSEVTARMGLTQEEYRDYLHATLAESMTSLDEMLGEGLSLGGQDKEIVDFERNQLLIAAIKQLSNREQVILSLYYQHELNLREIAATLGLTETRICQLHKVAVRQLQAIYRQAQL
ncbi:MAG: FliA/WhiG family RNA polymerase sigma factor [Shewanella algae]|nr:DNA-directed RNA polymerase sigma-70 factor [Shewanella algae]BCV42844.1 DNA-directed RNA polymerase sigma-70 factor [Shewanella algae]BCV55910.1 DNA-directed RNA polymerase sigma-70 factor [Shewanella algae]BCV60189.1 DNA-directed RNA polymerase sigma-70 factor [Shewanella algae]BCV63404.1 DNA-directed RNA polymerase sigma-70 factor [Shewanella algae]